MYRFTFSVNVCMCPFQALCIVVLKDLMAMEVADEPREVELIVSFRNHLVLAARLAFQMDLLMGLQTAGIATEVLSCFLFWSYQKLVTKVHCTV